MQSDFQRLGQVPFAHPLGAEPLDGRQKVVSGQLNPLLLGKVGHGGFSCCLVSI